MWLLLMLMKMKIFGDDEDNNDNISGKMVARQWKKIETLYSHPPRASERTNRRTKSRGTRFGKPKNKNKKIKK